MKFRSLDIRSIIFSFLLLVSVPLSAEPFMLSISPNSVFMDNSTYNPGFGRHAGLILPDVDQSSFAFGFSIPFGYVSGDPIYIGITWHTSADAPCTIELRPSFVSVAQRGGAHVQGTGASTGLSTIDGNNFLNVSESNISGLKVYVLTSPDGVTNMNELDAINIGFFRRPGLDGDTCEGDLLIQGIVVAGL